jgi:hypothetical protein
VRLKLKKKALVLDLYKSNRVLIMLGWGVGKNEILDLKCFSV